MAREYFKAFHSYLKSIEPLNDAERGRLFTAMLEYSITGEAPDLRGNERFIFPTMQANLDREIESYRNSVETAQANGSKGGRPPKNPKNPIGFSETQKTEVVFSKPNKTQDKDKGKDKDKDKEYSFSASALGGMSQELASAVEDWLAYKREKRQGYKDTGLKAFLTQVKNNADRYGDAAVIAVMQQSMSNGYQGVTWDKLKTNTQRQNDPLNSHRLDWIDEVTL